VRLDEPSVWEDHLSAEPWAPSQRDSPHTGEPRRRANPGLAALAVILVSLMVATGAVLLSRAASNSVASARASAAESRGVVDVVATIANENIEAVGTGIVLTSSGLILTNNHVISGAKSIEVTDAAAGATYPATVLGYDAASDVALLQLTGSLRLSPAVIATSTELTIGEAVIAVGNAGGRGGRPMAAKGTVTALDQTIIAEDELDGSSEALAGLVETNANVVSGDSGGPLLSTAGQVVGMDTAASSGFAFASGEGVSFAIPINSAMKIAGEIRSGRPASGVHVGPTAFLGVRILPNGPFSGSMVTAVFAGTPAAAIGIRPGDIIISIGGLTVESAGSFSTVMESYRPGATVVIRWMDPGGVPHSALAHLEGGPPA
jgi:S1-C subfamily serine protease